MKKLLALVLALVMSMSLVTISNAAFKDADKIDYDEAVTVMNAVGVLVGDENSNFNAKENLTRAQAAKIISYLLLGNKTAEALAGSGKFTDVAKTSWSAGFVDYCASTGVVNGVGNGKFDPNGQLTGYQFAKMLLVALGYDAKIEGFTGADWQINVSKRADQADLFDNLDISGNAALTREQAAQMCLNTLKSPLVEYSNKGGSLTVNGATVNIGASNAEYKTTSTKLAEQTIYANKLNSSAGEYIVEFAEQYYPKLVLDTDFDDFGRPCYTWSYDKKDLGTFAMKDMLEKTFVGEVTGKDLYDVLGKSVVEDYDVTVNIDGVEDSNVNDNVFPKTAMNKNNKKAVGGTGTGVVTEVYVNNDAKDVYIVIVNEYLAIASKDYDSKKESVDLTVYGITSKTVGTATEYLKKTDGTKSNEKSFKNVSSDDFALLTETKEDDAYVVTVAAGGIQTVVKAEVVEDATLSSFKQGDNVKADGTTYKYASAAEYDVEVLDKYTGTDGRVNLKDKTYNVYLDTHGNLLGIDIVKSTDNYVFITGVDTNSSNLSNKTYDAAAIFVDGTMKTIKIDGTKSTLYLQGSTAAANFTAASDNALINTWCTYTVSKDDVYTVKQITTKINTDAGIKTAQAHTAADYEGTIDKKNIALPAGNGYTYVYGNDDTVYIVPELKVIKANSNNNTGIINGVDNVTTGVKNASIEVWDDGIVDSKLTGETDGYVSYGAYTLYKSNGYIVAAVVVGEDSAASKNLAYVNSSSVSMEAYDSAKDEWTWTREVIIDGEKTEITEVGDDLTYLDAMTKGNWYQVKYNAAGNVIGISAAPAWSLGAAATSTSTSEYVNNINYLVASINAKDTVLYSQSFGTDAATAGASAPTMKGSTLYVDTAATKGFYVAEDAKVVFIQSNDGKSTTEYEVGSKEVQGFIDSLNDKNGDAANGYFYTVSAILKNGAAQVVIINDGIDSTYKKGTEELSSNVQVKSVVNSGSTTTIKYYVEDGTTPTFTDEAIAAILANEGYTEISKNGVSNTWSFKKGVTSYAGMTVTTTQVYKVTVKVASAVADKLTATADVEYAAASGTVTVTIKKNSGNITSARTITAYESDGTTVIGSPATVAAPSPAAGTVTGTYTMTAKDTILVIS